MAMLIECPTCSAKMSQRADSCPSCGEVNEWVHPAVKAFVDWLETDPEQLDKAGKYAYGTGATDVSITTQRDEEDIKTSGRWLGIWVGAVLIAALFKPLEGIGYTVAGLAFLIWAFKMVKSLVMGTVTKEESRLVLNFAEGKKVQVETNDEDLFADAIAKAKSIATNV